MRYMGRTAFDYLVELESEAAVRALKPDLERAGPAAGPRRHRYIPLGRAPRMTFVSRFFAPAAGVPEDPVTGSAHCGLAPFWADRLSKTELAATKRRSAGGSSGCGWTVTACTSGATP